MTTAPTPPPGLATIPAKLMAVENTLRGRLQERHKQAETAVTALVAGAHHCQYGLPGTAKTMLVDLLTRLIDGATLFRWLMTRFTTPEEIFGPISLKGLENDEFRRNLVGKLVASNIAFLDEIFKANSAILNALLTIMNEGLFFNGDQVVASRPIIFCGSNELPKEVELAALWDRVTFRMETAPVREKGSLVAVMKGRAARGIASTPIVPLITWDEIVQAQQEAALVEVTDEVHNAMLDLVEKLRREGIEPTVRRISDCIPIIQASAYRDGRMIADVDDMTLLRHVLWLETAHIPVVERLVLELANPLDKEALDLIKTVDDLATEVDKVLGEVPNNQDSARRRRGIELNGKLTRVSEDLDKLQEKVKKSPKRSEMVEEARKRLSEVVSKLLKELFDVDQ
jgi:MoxR-like ATPase